MPTRHYTHLLTHQHGPYIVGVDEVGRGAWAGPLTVVAALTGEGPAPATVDDSKRIPKHRHATAATAATEWVGGYGIGETTAEEIDTLGMSACLRLALTRALDHLNTPIDAVLIDGPTNLLAGTRWGHLPHLALPKLDCDEQVVAAASIIGKHHRDTHMTLLGDQHPHYEWNRNAGYPTPAHRAALTHRGATPLHRVAWKWADTVDGPWRNEPWAQHRLNSHHTPTARMDTTST